MLVPAACQAVVKLLTSLPCDINVPPVWFILPVNVKLPLAVSVASDLRKDPLLIPSTVSASNPEPEPSLPACHAVLP